MSEEAYKKVMTPTLSTPKILHADQEHAGLRSAVFALLFISFVLAYFGIRALLTALSESGTSDYAFVVSCGGALIFALGFVWLMEILMKRYWPSGRSVTLISDGLQLQTETEEQWRINQSHEPDSLFWYFDMHGWQRGGRERRVPRNWLCLAVEVKADKKAAVVYTYLTRGNAKEWLREDGPVHFHKISPKDVYDTSLRSRMKGPSRPEIPAAVLTGAEGQYWLAERRRWTEGFELPPKEFEQFMNHIQTTLLE